MNAKYYKPVTTAQIKKIYTLMTQQGIKENEKETIVMSLTDWRTQSVKNMTCREASTLIAFLLGKFKPGASVNTGAYEEKRRAAFKGIYALAWKMDIIYGDSDEDYQMNIAKLNMFCRSRGTVKKNLTEQTHDEMRRTHRQFEAIYRKFKKA